MQEILAGGIRNLGKCASGIRNSSKDWNPESKTVLDSLIWGDKAFKGIETKKLFNQHSYMVIAFVFFIVKLQSIDYK